MEGVLDTKTLIPIGINVAVVGGAVFWLNGKIKNLEEIVKTLGERNKLLEDALRKHDQILQMILNGGNNMQFAPAPRKPRSSEPVIVDDVEDEEEVDLDSYIEDELKEVKKLREEKSS